MSNSQTMTLQEWRVEACRRFGDDPMAWRFQCPVCKHIASVEDYKKAGATEGMVGFSCIGRALPKSSEAFSDKPGPCNYAGGGLFRLNPVTVLDEKGEAHQMFDFAPQSSPDSKEPR